MANNFHSGGRVYPCPSEIGRSTVTQIVKSEICYTSPNESGVERTADALKRSAFIREDLPRGKATRPSQSLQGHFDIWCHGNLTSGLCLRIQGEKGNKSPFHIDTVPGESNNLTTTLTKLIGGQQNRLQMGLGRTIQPPPLLIGQYSIPFIVGVSRGTFEAGWL